MTRWTFYLILADKLLSSVEFNGDMYPPSYYQWQLREGYGDEALKALEKVKTEEDFKKMVKKFNKTHHNYSDGGEVYEYKLEKLEKNKDFSKWYFDFWFSDRIFIKNMSWESHCFILRDYEWAFPLKNKESVRFNFWRIGEEDIEKYYPKMNKEIPKKVTNPFGTIFA